MPRPASEAAYHRWLFSGAEPVEAATMHQAPGVTTEDPQQQGLLGYGSLERVVDAAVAAASTAPHLAGWDAFSAADVDVGTQVGWGPRVGHAAAPPRAGG